MPARGAGIYRQFLASPAADAGRVWRRAISEAEREAFIVIRSLQALRPAQTAAAAPPVLHKHEPGREREPTATVFLKKPTPSPVRAPLGLFRLAIIRSRRLPQPFRSSAFPWPFSAAQLARP
jgi:hypothetical protein